MNIKGLRPFWNFYGGKWRVAPRYPAPLGPVIVEPFAGAAGYSLRHPDHDVLLVEIDPTIAALWRYLIRVDPEEIRALPLIYPGQSVDDLGVSGPARSLIGFWLNKGAAVPHRSPSAWMRDPRYARQFWGPVIRERVASQVHAIRHWRVIEGDYRQAPDVEATWFIDPPYSGTAGRYYRHHEIDYPALADWCRGRMGQVLVCEQHGADWLPFQPLLTAKATAGRHKTDAITHEVLWANDTYSREETTVRASLSAGRVALDVEIDLPKFDGQTYDPAQDGQRLRTQLDLVQALMQDGAWRTLKRIANAVGGSEAGVSARLRDLRKPRFGGHQVLRRRVPDTGKGGLWEYRLVPTGERAAA